MKTPAVGQASMDNRTGEEGTFYQLIHRWHINHSLTFQRKHTKRQHTQTRQMPLGNRKTQMRKKKLVRIVTTHTGCQKIKSSPHLMGDSETD